MKSQHAAQPNNVVARRRFCDGLVLTSATLLLAAANKTSARSFSNDHLVASAKKIDGAEYVMPGSSLLFCYPTRNDPAILVRTQDGHYYAYGQKCSHLGCSVQFNVRRGCLLCPCHQGMYDARSGAVVNGPPQRPLDQVFLERRGGEIWAIGRRSDYQPLIAQR